jgi:hypothetical protein
MGDRVEEMKGVSLGLLGRAREGLGIRQVSQVSGEYVRALRLMFCVQEGELVVPFFVSAKVSSPASALSLRYPPANLCRLSLSL